MRWPSRVTLPASAAGAGLAVGVLAGPVAGAIVGTYTVVALRAVRRLRAERASGVRRGQALDTLCALAADLRAGLPAPLAFDRPRALAALAEDPRLGRLAGAIRQLADRTGAPLADLMERLEADARAGDRARAMAAAQAAGAHATAWLLAALPLGGIALGYAIGTDPLHVLLHTPLGVACAAGAVVLQLAGLAWADRLTGARS